MEEKKDQYEVICFACGMPLKRQEIAVQITGQTIDFEERIAIQNTNYNLCTECAEKSRSYIGQGMKKAIERRDEMKKQLTTLDLTPGHMTEIYDPEGFVKSQESDIMIGS